MSSLSAIDTLGILEATASMPEQAANAVLSTRGLAGLPAHDDVENVVVVGMGGSGIAGDILSAAAGPYMPVPVVVSKTYEPPAFVGEGTLLFAISFSGDSEETIESATEAALQGAKVVAVTRGGELARRARSWGAPVIEVPADIPLPRTAVAALAIPPMVVLEEIGLFPGASQWIDQAVERLRVRRDQLSPDRTDATDLAKRIGRTIPLIYGGGAVGATAAQRWKTQMNENAKIPAFWNAQPELCHNEIVGFGQHGDLTRQAITLIALRHDFEHPQIMHRFDLVFELLDEVVAGIEQVHAGGEGQLAQLLDLILVGDFASVHMAAAEGVDPGPVPALDVIKLALKGLAS